MSEKKRENPILAIALFLIGLALAAGGIWMLLWVGRTVGSVSGSSVGAKSVGEAASSYEMYVNNLTSSALEGLLPIPKIYWLPEDTVIAPRPNPSCFGQTQDPADTAAVLEQARELLNGQETLWTPETAIRPGSTVNWYLDDTIFSITWKQPFVNATFCFSEVKVAHPSQFRRYFADNTFASPIQYPPTEMAQTVNAVTALSGDFYKFRNFGTVVYQRQLYRTEGNYLDNCFVDSAGDFHFVRRGQMTQEEDVLRYIADNDILFSLCFGPAVIEHGERTVPDNYLIGEINETYARCVLCQLGPCHYLLVTVNSEPPYGNYLNLSQVTDVLMDLGVSEAYTLDGGQTAAMYANGHLINAVEFGHQRYISDIVYFCTAIPDDGDEAES